MLTTHILPFLVLLLLSFTYFKIAKKLKIVDHPNHRSSHTEVTVRGGGIIFPVSVLLWWVVSGTPHTFMVIGLILISGISLVDDVKPLSRKLRFAIQFLALSLAFYDLGVFGNQPTWLIPILYFFALGIINAINFMDGINGITGLYFLSFFGTILAVNRYFPIFDTELVNYLIISLLVFLIFNLRKKALMFAGDIGSISMAYLVIYFLTQLYLKNGSWTVILLLLVYGADSFLTLVHRLLKGENVTLPHRTHLYQILVNQLKAPHVLIALIFTLLQLAFNFVFFIYPKSFPTNLEGWLILVVTAILYLGIKIPIQKSTR